MNITEANNLNTVLEWVTGYQQPYSGSNPPTSEAACNAAAVLADRAHKTLSAGLRGDDVHRNWPEVTQ